MCTERTDQCGVLKCGADETGGTASADSRRQNAAVARLTCVLSPADLSDSTLSYTETEAASSSNATPGEFSGWCVCPVSLLLMTLFGCAKISDQVINSN